MRLDIKAWRHRLLVVDTQIERGNRPRCIKRELDGRATALIKHCGYDAAVENACCDITDENTR